MATTPTATFAVGQAVLHAKHGAGTVTSIETQHYAGLDLECYVVAFERDKLTLRIPINGSGAAELRAVNHQARLEDVFAKLHKQPKVDGRLWAQREKEYRADLYSGDLLRIANVVRNLYVEPGNPRSFSATELYDEALQRLVAEVALVQNLDQHAALRFINEQVSGKTFALPRAPEAVARRSTTASPLAAERHPVDVTQKPPSAMEARIEQRVKAPTVRATVTPKTAAPKPLPRIISKAAAPERSAEDAVTIERLERSLRDATMRNSSLAESNRSLETQVTSEIGKRVVAERRFQETVQKLVEAQAVAQSIPSLTKAIADLETDYKAVAAERDALKAVAALLPSTVPEATSEVSAGARIRELTAEIAKLRATIKEVRAELKHVKSRRSFYAQRSAKLAKLLRDATQARRLEKLTKKAVLERIATVRAELLQLIAEKTSSLEGLFEALRNAEARVRELEEQR